MSGAGGRRSGRPRRIASRVAALAAAALLAPACGGAAAHVLGEAQAARAALSWSFEPWVVACLGLSAALYGIGLVRLWSHAGSRRGIGAAPAVAFAAGWVTLAAALVSPLDALGSLLFAAHMVQHELLMIVAAPLLVLGRPLAVWAWALPFEARRIVGRFFHRPGWRVPWLFLTGPLAAWALHALALWVWHVPALFEAALHDATVHAWQHVAFLATALVFWWSVLGATTRREDGVALLSLFTTMVHTGALGALLTLSPHAWYPSYAATAPAFGLDAVEDQQLGGLVMWIPAGLVYVVAGLVLAWRGLDGGGRRRGPGR